MKLNQLKYNFKYQIINRIKSRWMKLPYIWRLKYRYSKSYSIKPHSLPKPLIISLTSYPIRFKTLFKTLKCLLNQSVKPDKIILWIAFEDKEKLPDFILNLNGIDTKYCDDIKSFKKIIPTLKLYPDCFIVTADDDLFYEFNWLEQLVNAYDGINTEVICHRAHIIKINSKGLPINYKYWDSAISPTKNNLLFPTSGHGVLFPPNIFSSIIDNQELFLKLCPTSDDLWLWWMVRLNNNTFRKIGYKYNTLNTSRYNQIGLWYTNINLNGNDHQMKALIKKFGSNGIF